MGVIALIIPRSIFNPVTKKEGVKYKFEVVDAYLCICVSVCCGIVALNGWNDFDVVFE